MAKKQRVNPKYFSDQELSAKYNRLSDILFKYRFHYASDGTELKMLGLKPHIIKRTAHLPQEEQEMILIKHRKFIVLKSRLGNLKQKMRNDIGDNYETILEAMKTIIFELYAQHYSTEEIHKKLIEESGLKISFSAVKRFYHKYRPEIEKLQLDYEKEVGQIGVARKRSRLEVLDYMLRKIKQEFDNATGQKMLPYAREMKGVLEQARKEVEGEKIQLDINGNINITATIESAKSVEQLYSDINFMNLLIARVAARMRINPLLLQHQLTNSWYAKFTGIKRNDSLMDDVPDYPSKIILDWTDLQDKAEAKEKMYERLKQKYTEEVEILPTDEEVKTANKLRLALKEKLDEKKGKLDIIKSRISDNKK